MADLATQDDLEDRLGRTLTSTEQGRATAYLKDASGLVRRYTRQTFTEVDGDVVVLRPVGTFLVLPETPVTAVDSVCGVDENGTAGAPLSGWAWDGLDRISLATIGFPLDSWWPWSSGPDSFQVTYDHGSSTVPDDVISVVCGMVLRVLMSPSTVEGLNTERIGEYSYGFQQGGGGTPGVTVRLSEQDKADLKDYRPQAGSVQVRL